MRAPCARLHARRVPHPTERVLAAPQAAQWHDDRLREALPLHLTRPAATFGTVVHGATWLTHARDLLRRHLGAPAPSSPVLRGALDAALLKRHDLVERKRQQLVEFMRLSPAPI
eukprot:284288-Prymnesium_polylepis.1